MVSYLLAATTPSSQAQTTKMATITSSTSFPFYTPRSLTTTKTKTDLRFHFHPYNNKSRSSFKCKASSATSSSTFTSMLGFDLYDLLGIDSSSDQSQIKMAYRSLQKRCHPDIAGPAGHDMAIILNDAYAILSDPIARFAYDKVCGSNINLIISCASVSIDLLYSIFSFYFSI